MKKIDAHMHVIKQISGFGSKGELMPLGEGKAVYANGDIITLIPPIFGEYDCTPERLIKIMDKNNIEKAILLQGNYLGFQNLFSIEAAKKYPTRFKAAATLDPFCRDYEKIVKHLFDDLETSIIKMELSNTSGLMSNHDTIDLDSEIMNYLYKIAESRNLVFVIDIGRPGSDSYQIDTLRQVCIKYPKITFVICHLTGVRTNNTALLIDNLNKLNLSNVYFDLAALPNNTIEDGYPYKTAIKYIKTAISIVGADKLMWGSDAPQACTKIEYGDLISYIELSNEISDIQKEAIFYKTAKKVYFDKY